MESENGICPFIILVLLSGKNFESFLDTQKGNDSIKKRIREFPY